MKMLNNSRYWHYMISDTYLLKHKSKTINEYNLLDKLKKFFKEISIFNRTKIPSWGKFCQNITADKVKKFHYKAYLA